MIPNKPQYAVWFYVNNKSFNLSTDGFVQCAEDIPGGTYPFELTWKASS